MATETGDEYMEGSFPLGMWLCVSAYADNFSLSLEVSAAHSSILLFLEIMNKVFWETSELVKLEAPVSS